MEVCAWFSNTLHQSLSWLEMLALVFPLPPALTRCFPEKCSWVLGLLTVMVLKKVRGSISFQSKKFTARIVKE